MSGGALEQVAHQDVDRDLRLGAVVLQALLQRLAAELVEQRRGEIAEGRPRVAHVGAGAGQLPEQGQVVPDGLQLLERAAVFRRAAATCGMMRSRSPSRSTPLNLMVMGNEGPPKCAAPRRTVSKYAGLS